MAIVTRSKTETAGSSHGDMNICHQKCTAIVHHLQEAVEERSIVVTRELNEDLLTIMRQRASDALHGHPPSSFPRLFWKSQQRAASFSDKRSMRWDPLMIKWCIYLHHLSSTLRQTGVLHLPSQRTLRDYTHHIPANSGSYTVF